MFMSLPGCVCIPFHSNISGLRFESIVLTPTTDVGKDMDAQMERMRKHVEPVLGQFAFKEGSKMADGIIERVLEENRRAGVGWQAPQMVTPLIKRPVNVNERRK